ncbi:MAG TPA: 2-oxo-tetronate isomerase [Burkholderiales bacterium]|nr:2-oxo-tetronate isomerase [Burkholderiales bacterium]
MPKVAANLSLLFPQLPFLDRFAAARKAGFRYVEYQFPYAFGGAREVADAARAAGVEVVLHNLPAGDAAKGDRGIACQPARASEFREGVDRAIEYAKAAGCPRLNALAGIPSPGLDRETARQALVENLRFAAAKLKAAGLTLLTEPCNPRTIPGFLLNTSREGIEVIDAVGADNLKLQYDLFHMQIVEGDLAKTMERLLARIGHMQIADVPDRHEPGTGELNFGFLLAHMDRIGYQGWVGAEYLPKGDTVDGLKWAAPYLR